MTCLVFVYGTLKEGFPNFKTNGGVRMPGDYITDQSYPLVLVGDRHVPWLLNSAGQGENIIGQLFEVTPAQLSDMDRLERVGFPDGYQRELIRVLPADDPTAPMTVFAYLKDPALLSDQDVQSEMLADYTPEHAALYQSRVD